MELIGAGDDKIGLPGVEEVTLHTVFYASGRVRLLVHTVH